MDNCIFTAHCIENLCDKSCPILAEVSYLMERNGLSVNSKAIKNTMNLSNEFIHRLLQDSQGSVKSLINSETVDLANLITYHAICYNWKGNQLHCGVYNLRYSNYINLLKQSWNQKAESTELEYIRIWADSAKVLIISGIDYVNFNDFECQTLLSLIQSRHIESKSTIIISPPLKYLVGKSSFFNRILDIIQQGECT